jgi:hypothetical protein
MNRALEILKSEHGGASPINPLGVLLGMLGIGCIALFIIILAMIIEWSLK